MLPLAPKSHPALRCGADIIFDFEYVQKLLPELWSTMYHNKGIGLAAPQVGIPFSIAIMQIKLSEPRYVFINAMIVAFEGERVKAVEGCLSLPGLIVQVPRHEVVTITAHNEFGEVKYYRFEGTEARCVQHEMDHLTGRTIETYL